MKPGGRVAALLAAAAAGCFSPEVPSGSIRCGDQQSCPPALVCAIDGTCRRPGETVAGEDAGPPRDPAPDAACMPAQCGTEPRLCGVLDNGCGQPMNCGPCMHDQTCVNHVCVKT